VFNVYKSEYEYRTSTGTVLVVCFHFTCTSTSILTSTPSSERTYLIPLLSHSWQFCIYFSRYLKRIATHYTCISQHLYSQSDTVSGCFPLLLRLPASGTKTSTESSQGAIWAQSGRNIDSVWGLIIYAIGGTISYLWL
jgi:hypothetical protein